MIQTNLVGHIAYMIGCPQNSRRVGSSLKHCRAIITQLLNDTPELLYNYETLPWFRVVSSTGKISPRDNSSSEVLQARLLEAEGVVVLNSHLIDLDQFGWFPDEVED